MANLNLNGNLSEHEKTLENVRNDLISFGVCFSPQDFMASKTPDFHRNIGKLLLDRDIQQLALVLPRDHAKSTLAACAVLHRFLFATKDSQNLSLGLARHKTKLLIILIGYLLIFMKILQYITISVICREISGQRTKLY